jgi:hypothetical protein
VSLGWIIFCAALTAANWATIGQDVKAHPKVWVVLLVACVLMQYPVIWYGAAWLRRRKLAELNEVKRFWMKWTEKACREIGSIDPAGQWAIRRSSVRPSD